MRNFSQTTGCFINFNSKYNNQQFQSSLLLQCVATLPCANNSLQLQSSLWLLFHFNIPPLWSKHHFISLTCTICLCTIYPPHSHPALQTLLHNCAFFSLLPPFFVLFFFPSTVLQYLVTFATPSKSSRLSHLKEKLIKHHFTAH